MDNENYVGKIDSVLLIDKSEKNYSYRALFTSENFIPQSQYTNETVIGYIREALKSDNDILFIPEYKKVTFAHMRINKKKLEKGHNFREMSEQVTIDTLGLLHELGFKERDDASVILTKIHSDAFNKLTTEYSEYPDRLKFMVVINKKIYIAIF